VRKAASANANDLGGGPRSAGEPVYSDTTLDPETSAQIDAELARFEDLAKTWGVEH